MRESPRMVVAWTVDGGKKTYATKKQAYYAQAKALVVAKYPAWLGDLTISASARGIPEPTATMRTRKMYTLFYLQDFYGTPLQFDGELWKRFVRRVARFLEFVDSRRTLMQMTSHVAEDDCQARYEFYENKSQQMAEAACHWLQALQLKIDSRSRTGDTP